MRMLNQLVHMMQVIEATVIDETGAMNRKKAQSLPLYSVFEEALCELQGVNLNGMADRTKIVSCDHQRARH